MSMLSTKQFIGLEEARKEEDNTKEEAPKEEDNTKED